MEVKVIIRSEDLSKEELRALIQGIRDSEQKSFPEKEIFIWIEAPELSAAGISEILAGIKPPYPVEPISLRKRHDGMDKCGQIKE